MIGIHADQTRRQMADREELHELHVDQLGAGAQRQRVAVAAHVGRRAVAAIKSGQTAGRDDHGLGRKRHRTAGRHMQRGGATGFAVLNRDINDEQIADRRTPLALFSRVRSVFDTAGPVERKST